MDARASVDGLTLLAASDATSIKQLSLAGPDVETSVAYDCSQTLTDTDR